MTIKFLDLQKQYHSIKAEIDKAIQQTIEASAFVGGSPLRQFEEKFADYQKTAHCVGVGNGTDALEIAIEALDLPPGSEIIVPANSFIATSEAVTRCGHKVVFCDADPDNYTVSIESLKSRLGDKTAAVIAVHLYGHPCEMDEVCALAKTHNFKVIEDCAQAHGAEYKSQRVGGIGDIGTFSFYPGKNLGAYGDGGAITTNDEELAVKARMIANHGRVEKYNHQFEGRNSRLDGLQAAILMVKLKHLDRWIEARQSAAAHYFEGLFDHEDISLPQTKDWVRHVYHLFVIRHAERNDLMDHLKNQNIESGIHYPTPLPDLEAYAYLQSDTGDISVSRLLAHEILSLPMGEHMDEAQVRQVVEACSRFNS